MKHKLEIGGELDFLTKDELDSSLDRMEGIWRSYAKGFKRFRLPVMRGAVVGGAITLGSTNVPEQQYVGPRPGWVWRLTRLSAAGLVSTPARATVATAAFAAGAAGTATLPAGSALTGFDITTAAPAAAVTATVTVSNIFNGPYVYDLTEAVATGGMLSVRYPNPQFAPAGGPTVAIAATAGGAAGHINAYGTVLASVDQLAVYVGEPGDARFMNLLTATAPTWTPDNSAILLPGDYLVASGSALGTTTPVTVSGEVIEAPAEEIYKVLAG